MIRYIHQNPIKAGLVKTLVNYQWSSYKYYLDHSSILDIDFALDICSADRVKAIEIFKQFSNEESNDECLEYKDNISLSDKDILEHLNKLGVETISELQGLEREHRNSIIKSIKSINGVSLRQLSRITGISKSVIDRA